MMDGLQVQWLLDRQSVDMAEGLETYFRGIVDLGPILETEPGAPAETSAAAAPIDIAPATAEVAALTD
jgi:hypothetical protein